MMMMMSSTSASSSSATVAVEKATSELLMSPDWTMNIDICDSVNSHQWQAKDIVKAVKKRMQHRSVKVQLLALTLLETMVKNCSDSVHFQIAERNVLGEMVKIAKKRGDSHVRDKILVLLDSWQEAFGGRGGKHPQYFYAYEDLRRSGIPFPKRTPDSAPIFTPPVTHPTLRHTQAGYGMPSNSSRRLDETMATEIETISLSSLDSMRDVMELLSDMLQAVNPSDREAVKDEVIVDLVNRCRSNQKKLMQMLTTTGDEELLGQGLELNDGLQILLAKHDAISFGSPMPAEVTDSGPKPVAPSASSHKSTEVSDSSPRTNGTTPPPSITTATKGVFADEDDEEDDFAQLARRHTRLQHASPKNVSTESGGELVPVSDSTTSSQPEAVVSSATPSKALVLADPPAPVKTSVEQDIIDLLSITLTTTPTSSNAPPTPTASNQNSHQVPSSSPNTQSHPYDSQTYPSNQGQATYSNYVAPWAQSVPQSAPQAHTQPQSQSQFQYQPQSQPHYVPQAQAHYQPQAQPQYQNQSPYHYQAQPQVQQYPSYSSAYPPPPWATTTSGYYNNHNHYSTNGNNMFSTPSANTYTPGRPLQHYNSFNMKSSNGSTAVGDLQVSSSPRVASPNAATKPFIPSYRLFEDLNVLGNGNTPAGLSGAAGPSMVGGRK